MLNYVPLSSAKNGHSSGLKEYNEIPSNLNYHYAFPAQDGVDKLRRSIEEVLRAALTGTIPHTAYWLMA
ncbi:hypothetical protein BC629DRAFT_902125 [Irpex lacteus]|nr:hypothetical protein BC629DRAFT_902125 [Irpex lacteus]